MGEFNGRPQDQSKSRRAERERSRPFLLRWLNAVEAKVASKRLSEFHLRLGKKLTNYPSANVGKCWTGQVRLGRDLGKSPRTVRQGLKDMRDEGLLIRTRGGPGKTATQWFAIGAIKLFETSTENIVERGQVVDFPFQRHGNRKRQERQDSAGLERQDSAGLERQDSATKPFEQNPFEHDPIEPPQAPTVEDTDAGLIGGSGRGVLSKHRGCGGETARSLAIKEVETVLDGEIIGPLSFSDFWNGSRRHSDNKDKPGPARKAFDALSQEERQEITVLLERDGEIDLGGEWSCIWLKARAWREDPLRRSGIAGLFQDFRPRPGSREDRQERTANARRQFREWVQREDADTGNNTAVAVTLGNGIAGCPPGHYPIVEHTRAFDEWCQHYRRHRRVPPLAMDIVDQDGRRRRGFYMPTPFPPSDDGGSA